MESFSHCPSRSWGTIVYSTTNRDFGCCSSLILGGTDAHPSPTPYNLRCGPPMGNSKGSRLTLGSNWGSFALRGSKGSFFTSRMLIVERLGQAIGWSPSSYGSCWGLYFYPLGCRTLVAMRRLTRLMVPFSKIFNSWHLLIIMLHLDPLSLFRMRWE